MDLNTLSLKELKKLRKDVDKTIADFKDRKKREALAELEKKAAEMGFSLSELASVGKAKKVSPPKYRNPNGAGVDILITDDVVLTQI